MLRKHGKLSPSWSQVMDIVANAAQKGQDFTMDVVAEVRECAPVNGWATHELTGACEIIIRVMA